MLFAISYLLRIDTSQGVCEYRFVILENIVVIGIECLSGLLSYICLFADISCFHATIGFIYYHPLFWIISGLEQGTGRVTVQGRGLGSGILACV